MPWEGKHKFGFGNDDDPYVYPNIYEREGTTGPDRLVIGPASGQVELLLALSDFMPEPLGLLYVLITPLTKTQRQGRFQAQYPMDRLPIAEFVTRFAGALENDSRHSLWISAPQSGGNLIYDNHNVIYAYGPLTEYERLLRSRGFTEAPVRFPVPHVHRYHKEWDDDVDAMLSYWEWQHFPLRDEDDP